MTSGQIGAVKRYCGWLDGPSASFEPAWVLYLAERGSLVWMRCLAEPQIDVAEEKMLKEFQDSFQDAFRSALRKRRSE